MTKSSCISAINMLQYYKQSKYDLFAECVAERLDKSIESYNKEVKECMDFISHKKALTVLRVMNRIDSKK